MDKPTFVLDGYFVNMVNDVIMVAESDDVELSGIDVLNIAVYTLHSIATSGNDYFKANYNADAIKTTLNSVIGDNHSITGFLGDMKDAIESGDAERMDADFVNIGGNSGGAVNG